MPSCAASSTVRRTETGRSLPSSQSSEPDGTNQSVGQPHRVDGHLDAGQRGFEVDRHARTGVAATEPAAGPVADHAAGLASAETDRPTRQMAATIGQPRREPIGQRQQPAARRGERAPVRRAAGDQPQPLRRIGSQCEQAGRQLRPEAVAADDPRHVGTGGLHRRERGRQVVFEQGAIAPVAIMSGAHVAAAVAAPFVHEHRDATRGQRLGERQVVLRGHAQRRQPDQGRHRRRRPAHQHPEAMSVGRNDRQALVVRRRLRVARRCGHAGSAAPKWSSTRTSPRPGRMPVRRARWT